MSSDLLPNDVVRVVAAAVAALNILGLPILIQLLVRLHDQHAKFLDQYSAKAVWEQVNAIRQLQEWHAERLRGKISSAESDLGLVLEVLGAQPYQHQRSVVDRTKRELSDLAFVLQGKGAEEFLAKARRIMNWSEASGGAWNVLEEYEALLVSQIRKIEELPRPASSPAPADQKAPLSGR
jgi:hypothetical protein